MWITPTRFHLPWEGVSPWMVQNCIPQSQVSLISFLNRWKLTCLKIALEYPRMDGLMTSCAKNGSAQSLSHNLRLTIHLGLQFCSYLMVMAPTSQKPCACWQLTTILSYFAYLPIPITKPSPLMLESSVLFNSTGCNDVMKCWMRQVKRSQLLILSTSIWPCILTRYHH